MAETITKTFDIWTTAQTLKTSNRGRSASNQSLLGIIKLRELILELALRGKLISQDSNDEPASELLKKIAKEKVSLIKEGKIRKQEVFSKIEEDEKLYELPKGWEWSRLVDYYDVRDGTHDSPKATTDGYPLITSKNLYTGKLDLSNVTYISEEDHLKIIERSKVDKYDILFAMIGSIGNPVIVDIDIEFSIKNVALFKYYVLELSSPKYLQIFLKAASIDMKEKASGGVQSFVSLGNLRAYLMPIPPLAEQQRIVAKVDELMALCDQLEQQQTESNAAHETLVEVLLGTLTNAESPAEFDESWQRIAAHFDTLFTTEHSIDQLKQTILQLAVMGKLTPQNPEDEPASELLKIIAKEKARLVKEGVIKKQVPLPTIAAEDKPFELPEGWEWCYLEDTLAIVTDGDHQAPPQTDSGVPFLVIGNLNTGKIVFENCKYVPSEYYESLGWSRKPEPRDILYTVTGSYGISIPVESNRAFCVQRHVAILKSVVSTPQKYLLYALSSKYALNYASEIATGIAQKTVPLTGLRKMPIPLPALSEQHRIVSKVDELVALCDALKERINQAQTTQNQLAEAVVKQTLG